MSERSTGVGGLACITRAGLAPTVAGQLAEEQGRDDIIDTAFFHALRGHRVVEVELPDSDGPPPRFPMLCSNASHIAAMYTLPLDEARALLPEQQRLSPVPVVPRQAAIVVYGHAYRRSGLGAYVELSVAVMVMHDGCYRPPRIDVVSPGRYPRLGLFPLVLMIDGERACAGSQQLYGLPTIAGEGELSLQGGRGVVTMSHGGQLMARFEIALNERSGGPQRLRTLYSTYSILNERLIRSRYDSIADGYLTRHGEVSLSFGDHPRVARLGELSLSPEPMQLRLASRLNTIVWSPEDLGELPGYQESSVMAPVPEPVNTSQSEAEPERVSIDSDPAEPQPEAVEQPEPAEPQPVPEPKPQITGVDPSEGSCVGGDTLTIEGHHFGSEATVRIGTSSAEVVRADGSTKRVVMTPPRRSPGWVDIEIVAASGASARLSKAFRYKVHPPPKITAVAPHRGSISGGTEISIEGNHFAAAARVLVGGVPATHVKRLDDTTLEAKTPPGKHGKMVDISVENPDGHKAVATRAFMYDERYG